MYAIYGNMDPINIPQMLAYIPFMDPMSNKILINYKCPTFVVVPYLRPKSAFPISGARLHRLGMAGGAKSDSGVRGPGACLGEDS
jgi:hypothetical protein